MLSFPYISEVYSDPLVESLPCDVIFPILHKVEIHLEDWLLGHYFRYRLYYEIFPSGVQQVEYVHNLVACTYVRCLVMMQSKFLLWNDYSLLNYKKPDKGSVMCQAKDIKLCSSWEETQAI